MCKFFSFTTKGDGKPMYMPLSERKKIIAKKSNYEKTDSHTSINDFHGIKGYAEDKTNKYEFCPFTLTFTVDQLNTIDDSKECEKWVRSFVRSKKFKEFYENFNSDLDLRGCDLKGITLPTSVGGSLYLRGCEKKQIEQIKSKYPKFKIIN